MFPFLAIQLEEINKINFSQRKTIYFLSQRRQHVLHNFGLL
jgi:hypothetical protein